MLRSIALAIALLLLAGIPISLGQEPAPPEEEMAATEAASVVALEDSAAWTGKDYAYVLAAVLSPLISFFGVGVIVFWTRRNVMSEQRFKANEAEAEFIQNKLDKFYGPFLLISNTNNLMAQDLRSRQPKPEEHRLLERLFDEEWRARLSAGDSALVAQICETGERLSNLIEANAGLVSPEILPYLSRVMAHFRVLKLAHDRKLGTEKTPFMRYVYPRALDPVLEKELQRLQDRLALLREKPTEAHGKLSALDLSPFPLEDWPMPIRLPQNP